MFTFIQNYKKVFMMGIQSYLQGAETSTTTDDAPVAIPDDTPESQALATEQAEAQEAIKGVTREQLQDLNAALTEVNAGNSIKRGSNESAVRDIQEIFIHLGIDIGTFGSQGNGVDGNYGSTMTRVVSAFQEEKGLPQTGEVDQATYDALLIDVGLSLRPIEARVASTEKEVETARTRAAAQARELQTAKAAVAQELAETQLAAQALEANTGAIRTNMESFKGKTGELQALEGQLLALRSRLENAESLEARVDTYNEAQATFSREQTELQEVQGNIAVIQRQLDAQGESLREAALDNATEQNQARQAQIALEAAQIAFNTLNTNGGIIPTVSEAQEALRIANATLATYDTWFHRNITGSYTASQASVELAQKNLELAQAKEALDAAQALVTRESTEAQVSNERFGEARLATQALESQVRELQTQLTTAQREFETARVELTNSLTGPQTSPPEDTEALRQQITGIEEKTGALRGEISALESTLEGLRSNTTALETAVKTQESELAKAQALTPEVEARDESARVGLANAERLAREAETELIREMTAEEALAALDMLEKENGHGAIKAIQEALIALGVDLGATGADGDVGPRTTAGIQAHPQVVLDTLATYIDTTDNTRNAERVIAERPVDGDAIDAALESFLAGQNSTITFTADVASQIASEFTGEGIDANRRNANAQYIALRLQELGMENNTEAQRLMERIMAEGKGHYENPETAISEALYDGSGRFASHIRNFPENFNGSYYKIGNRLDNYAPLIPEMEASTIKGNADAVLDAIFGVHSDYIATRMHVVTGQGRDGDADMSLELAGGIILSNAYYDAASGAIYAVVARGNGCEGNLVVIPVETFIAPPPAPKPVPRVPIIPEEDTAEDTPEDTEDSQEDSQEDSGEDSEDTPEDSEDTEDTPEDTIDTTPGGGGEDTAEDTAEEDTTASDDGNTTTTESDDNGPPTGN